MQLSNISVLAYANNFTLWHYKVSKDEDINEANFFNKAADMCNTGDLVIIVDILGQTTIKTFMVDGNNVSISNLI